MTQKLPCCLICGYYLTTNEQHLGYRCMDPGHWQAAGLLSSHDFYLMVRMVAGSEAELVRRADNQNRMLLSAPELNLKETQRTLKNGSYRGNGQ